MFKLSHLAATAGFESLRAGLDGRSVTETNGRDRLAFRDLPQAARLCVIIIVATYVATAGWVAPHTRPIVLTTLIPIFILAVLVKPLPHPLGGIQAANSGTSMTAALMWAPPEVILGVGIGSVVGARVFRRAEWWKAANNAASWGISGGVDAAVAQSVMSVLPHGMLRIIAGASAVVLAHFVTNRAMFSLYRSYRFRRPFLREWRQSLSFSWPQELFLLPAVVVIAAVAYSLNDFAWSLAIAPATTLLVPFERWIDCFRLDITMRKRASVAPVKTQALISGVASVKLTGGSVRKPRRPWAPSLQRLVDLATTGASAVLVSLARRKLGRHCDRTTPNQAASVLQQSETRFRALMAHISEGISLINAEGTILYLSPSARRILGHRVSKHVGRNWLEIYDPEDSARLKDSFSSLVRDPGSHFTADARMLHTDGSWRWVHTIYTNLLMEPSVQAIVVIYRDITQARRSEETLEEYAARLEDLSRRLVQSQEMERRRIAQELHDETGQILTGLKLTLDVALKQIGESEAKSTLSQAATMLETLHKHVRALSLDLRPTALDDLGLLPAALLLCDQYTAQTAVQVKFIHSGVSGRRFASEIETTAYRIIQEGLTNVARHARVQEALVRMWADEEVLGIQVEDYGKGFVIDGTKLADRSSGLPGMRERVALVGGEFVIESTPGTGTRLTAELPFRHPRVGAVPARE